MSACTGTWEDLDDNVAGFAAPLPRMCGYQSTAMSPALSKGPVDEYRAWKQEPWEVCADAVWGSLMPQDGQFFLILRFTSLKKPYEVFTMKIISVY